MAYPLHYFIQKTSHRYQLKQLAGEKGLEQMISWVYLMEDIQNTDFLRGGELVITTGMSITGEDALLAFARKLYHHKACGLLINVGHYIGEIPASLIDFCNTYQFPLFTMPWDIHIADIMEQYCNEIMIQKQVDMQIQEAFEKVLFEEENIEHSLQILYRYGLGDNTEYHIFASSVAFAANWIHEMKGDFFSFYREAVYYGVAVHIHAIPSATEPMGFSSTTEVSSFPVARKHAYEALLVSRINHKRKDSFPSGNLPENDSPKNYNEIGLYQTVFAISDPDMLRSLCFPLLQPLIQYDTEKGTSYLELTRLYLELDGSIQKVAETTFTHRNTINYRMGKIKALLKTDFSSLEECCRYQIAFYIYDILALAPVT